MSMYVDEVLVCRDCNAEFVFTAGEQEFFAQRGFANKPTRCKACRDNRKQGAGSGPRPMFEVTCSECGAPARVPFEPRDDRPVYCSNCFAAKSGR